MNQNDQRDDQPQPTQSSLEETLRTVEQQAADNLAGWQRARADYQNLKRESERKQAQFMADAKEMILEDLLPIYDQVKRAVDQSVDEAHLKVWRQGIAQIKGQWDTLLQQWRVEPVPTVGERFNPEVHEAIEIEGESAGDTVIREVEGGYLIDGKLLYPARVVVGHRETPPSDESPPSDEEEPAM